MEDDIMDGLLGHAQGPRSRALGLEYVRDLGEQDLTDIQNLPVGSALQPLAKISFKHHAIAQLIAQGKGNQEISAVTGYTGTRISSLKSDPAFAELIQFYATKNLEIYAAAHEKLAMLGITAVDSLQESLEDSPESFSIREKIEVAEMALDRSIAPSKGAARGPSGTASGLTVNIQFQKPEQESTIQTIDVIPTKD